MSVVGDDIVQLRPRQFGLISREVDFGQLHFGARIGMVVGHLFPDGERGVGFTQCGESFRERHLCVAVVVLGFFRDDAFQERAGFLRPFLAQQALTEVSAGIEIFGVAFQ